MSQGAFAADSLAVDVGPVETAEILENKGAGALDDAAMLLGHNLVQELDRIARMPPERVLWQQLDNLLSLRCGESEPTHEVLRLTVVLAQDKPSWLDTPGDIP